MSILLSLLSSLMFAFTFVLVKIGVKTSSSLAALWVTLSTNVVFLWGWGLLKADWQLTEWWEWRHFVLAGIFAPLLGRLFQILGMTSLGANITTPITLTHPLFTVLLAIIFLGEDVDLAVLPGIGLVLLGTAFLGSQSGRQTVHSSVDISRWYLFLPLAASLSYGVSVVFRKIGIDNGTDPVIAAAVTTTASWVILVTYLIFSKAIRGISRHVNIAVCGRDEFFIFVISGLFSSLGPVFLYMALQDGRLSVVAPLASTTPFFVLLMSVFFRRGEDVVNRWVVLGTIAMVAGISSIVYFGIV
ncbi:DMT family transporter [Halomonas kalidii]|uniref:EamA family transporter n=1 Tax=Halomonas kalidii TaxID=3043293 RepID=A0ABT6VQ37_9GAMM|nr:EamA family transporter [Halomonas kalidii]MDI5936086.1 EamA family transporter [Halomonas kalidii]